MARVPFVGGLASRPETAQDDRAEGRGRVPLDHDVAAALQVMPIGRGAEETAGRKLTRQERQSRLRDIGPGWVRATEENVEHPAPRRISACRGPEERPVN